jgi:predicted DNA-binding transcriptional regulator AlpA
MGTHETASSTKPLANYQSPQASSFIAEQFLTERELAMALGKSLRTLRRWHTLRIGPNRTRVGRSIVYNKNTVRDWLATQESRQCRARGRR